MKMKKKIPSALRRAIAKVKSERAIQAEILTLLRAQGIPHSVTDASRSWGPDGRPRKSKVTAGWPDISCVLPRGPYQGRAFFIEVKAARGRVSREQRQTFLRLDAAWSRVFIGRSAEDVLCELRRWEAEK